MIDEDISAGRTCFPLKCINEETCQRKRYFGDDIDGNRTRLKDIVIERFPVLKEEIGFRREVMLVPASALKHLITTSSLSKNMGLTNSARTRQFQIASSSL